MQEKNGQLYRRLLRYNLPYWYYFALGVIGFTILAGTEALLVMLIEFFINTLEGKTTARFEFIPESIRASIYFVPLAAIGLSIVQGLGGFLGNFYMTQLGMRVVHDLRKSVFDHSMSLPQNFFDKHNSSELVSLIVYNIEQVTGSVTSALKILFRDGLTLLAFLIVLLYLHWQLTLLFLLTAPVLALFISFASRYFRRTSRRIQDAVGMITHVSTEGFQGIKLVKSYRGENYERERFKQASGDNLRFGLKFARVNALQTPIMHFVIAIAMSIIFLLVILFWEGSAAEAVVYISLAGLITKPLRQLSTIVSVIQKGLAAAESIFNVLDLTAEKDTGNQTLTNPQGKVAFKNVSFSYEQGQPAIKQLDFVINAGETVALVGASGSGKSTLANLLLRFYEPDSGEITLDGIPLTQLSLSSLRDNIALVNQQTTLFNDSVSANIAYAIDRDKIDQEKLQSAADHAYASEFISQLEEGFDTIVGESGARLSGGQRQRISIARALYKNAPILILDEATSALDNESEKQIQKALEKLKQGRTTLLIAHRLSTIENSDKIIVLEKGEIVESGSHEQLLAQQGAYANLYRHQLTS